MDGEATPVYDRLHCLNFSPDGKRVGCVAERGGKLRAVVDGVEGKEYDLGLDENENPLDFSFWLEFSPDSKRVAYTVAEQTDRKFLVVLDGREGKRYDRVDWPTFARTRGTCCMPRSRATSGSWSGMAWKAQSTMTSSP